MADRPISFKAPMIRALLAGTKTQTRRLIKPQPPRFMHYGKDIMDWSLSGVYQDEGNEGTNRWWLDVQTDVDDSSHTEFKVSAAVGDRLWVKEAWRTLQSSDCLAPRHLAEDRSKITYEADTENRNPFWAFGRLRASMHMPRWASRLTLTVTDVRVQRLQDISCADAIAEGIPPLANSATIDCDTPDPREDFARLWDSINKDRCPWSSNPWVVAYSFTVHRCNIDEMEGAIRLSRLERHQNAPALKSSSKVDRLIP